MEKPAETQYPIHPLIKARWSPRAFEARPVEPEKLLRLFEAARWSPSGGNLQPWTFLLITSDEPEAHARLIDVLGARNQIWARQAPVLILAIAKTERQPGVPNRWSWYDVGQAVALLSVQATAEGLVMHQMAGFDAEKAREQFGIPGGYEAVTAIALGYRGSPDDLPEDFRIREREPRSRKALHEFVFGRQWGQALQIETESQPV
jgi:nitroreductase